MPPNDCTWWSDRWAWRGAIAAAPLGALAAIVHALVVVRAPFGEALVAYLVGALVASGIGCVVAGPLGGVACALRQRRDERDRAQATLEVLEEQRHVPGGEQLALGDVAPEADIVPVPASAASHRPLHAAA